MDTVSLAGKVIDTHAHVYPAKYLDFLEQIGVDPDSTAIARDMNASNEDEEVAARLRMMDEAGVDVQVLSATPQLPQVDQADLAAQAARKVNDIYAEIIKKYPDRFLAYGAIPFLHPGQAVSEIGYCLDELGFVGIAINSLLPDPQAAITDDRFAPIFAELDRRHAPIYSPHGDVSSLRSYGNPGLGVGERRSCRGRHRHLASAEGRLRAQIPEHPLPHCALGRRPAVLGAAAAG